MSSERAPIADPLIEEVRERRRQVFADCDHDLDKLREAIEALQREHPEKLVDRRKESSRR
jgi:hypothetical protein